MLDRQQHRQEVLGFLHNHFPGQSWELTLPEGSGSETYFAHSSQRSCFVKLGVPAERYQALASIGLTPQVLAVGSLGDGTTILVQVCIAGRNPSRRDFQAHLEQFAAAIHKLHHHPAVRQVLPTASSSTYQAAGLAALERLRDRWEFYRPMVPESAGFIDRSLDTLRQQVMDFQGAGLVASHNDICNANWILSPDGHLYLVDFESMSLDDPAADIGALLWWYYPPTLRQEFLKIVDHADDSLFVRRMRVRMAMHCLNITLPREQSFDIFDPDSFSESLTDFRTVLAGEENPQGYED